MRSIILFTLLVSFPYTGIATGTEIDPAPVEIVTSYGTALAVATGSSTILPVWSDGYDEECWTVFHTRPLSLDAEPLTPAQTPIGCGREVPLPILASGGDQFLFVVVDRAGVFRATVLDPLGSPVSEPFAVVQVQGRSPIGARRTGDWWEIFFRHHEQKGEIFFETIEVAKLHVPSGEVILTSLRDNAALLTTTTIDGGTLLVWYQGVIGDFDVMAGVYDGQGLVKVIALDRDLGSADITAHLASNEASAMAVVQSHRGRSAWPLSKIGLPIGPPREVTLPYGFWVTDLIGSDDRFRLLFRADDPVNGMIVLDELGRIDTSYGLDLARHAPEMTIARDRTWIMTSHFYEPLPVTLVAADNGQEIPLSRRVDRSFLAEPQRWQDGWMVPVGTTEGLFLSVLDDAGTMITRTPLDAFLEICCQPLMTSSDAGRVVMVRGSDVPVESLRILIFDESRDISDPETLDVPLPRGFCLRCGQLDGLDLRGDRLIVRRGPELLVVDLSDRRVVAALQPGEHRYDPIRTASLSDHGVMIVYSTFRFGQAEILADFFDVNLEPVTTDVVIGSFPFGSLRIALASAQDRYLVVILDDQERVFATVYDASGNEVASNPFGTQLSHDFTPKVSIAARELDDGFVVSWLAREQSECPDRYVPYVSYVGLDASRGYQAPLRRPAFELPCRSSLTWGWEIDRNDVNVVPGGRLVWYHRHVSEQPYGWAVRGLLQVSPNARSRTIRRP